MKNRCHVLITASLQGKYLCACVWEGVPGRSSSDRESVPELVRHYPDAELALNTTEIHN